MSGALVLAGVAAAGAAALAWTPTTHAPGVEASAPTREERLGVVRRWRALWAISALLGAVTILSGPLSLVVGVVGAVAVWVLAGSAETAGERRTRVAAAAQLPHLVDLYATALQAGAAPGPALEQVCAALPGPASDELRGVRAALGLGVSPSEVWGDLCAHPVLGQLGRAMTRSQDSGAPVVEVTRRLADDLAAEARLDVEDRARTVGVRAAVPLGLCLLPAFLLLGIVPLIVSAVTAISW